MNQRFRRLTDLFVDGRTVTLPDGTFLWVQAINAYERDECISDAQVARSRLVMALKENGNERVKVEARLVERGRDSMIEDVVRAKTDDKYNDIIAELEADPDWTEKVSILRRTDFTEHAKVASQEERDMVDRYLSEWTAAIEERTTRERDWQDRHYRSVSDQELLEDYLEMWLDRRGSEVATAEYALTELWYATRYCEATRNDGVLDHARCEGHPQRVFPTKSDARAAPDRLQRLVSTALGELVMADRDPKGSASPANSSDSSPTPSEPAASTPSTSVETHELPPGTSSPPLVTH